MKIGISAIIVSIFAILLTVSALLMRHVKPLIPTSFEVLYTETEDFLSDGKAYVPAFRRNLLYIHLPRARPEHRWWVINYNSTSVSSPRPPAFLIIGYMVFQKDFYGAPLDENIADKWMRRFDGKNISFAGDGLTCIVRRHKR